MLALLNRFERREFRLVLGGLSLLLIAGAMSYAVVPQWKLLSTSQVRLKAVKTLPPTADVSAQLDGMREMVKGLQHAVHGETGDLPARELESYLIGKLQAISWSHDVELASIRPGQRAKVMGFWETTFKLEVTGEYPALYAWLNDLSAQLGYIVIKEFQLNTAGGQGSEPLLKAAMTIASYQSSQ